MERAPTIPPLVGGDMIHDYTDGVARCGDCHEVSVLHRSIPPGRIHAADSILIGRIRYQYDGDVTDGLRCDSCGRVAE